MPQEVNTQLLEQQDIIGKHPETGEPLGPDPTAVRETPVLPEAKPKPGDTSVKKDTPARAPSGTPDAGEEETYRTRYGAAVKWAQEEKTARQKLEERERRWRAAGIDPDEIDRTIANLDSPADASTSSATTAKPEGDYATKKELETMRSQYLYDTAKTKYVVRHPEFEDAELSRLLDLAVGEEVTKERQELNGRVVSSPDIFLATAGKRVMAFVNRLKKQGADAATEQRTKIDETAMPEGGTEPKPTVEPEAETFTGKDYARSLREQREKIKQRTAP